MEAMKLLQTISQQYQTILGNQLTGIYIHGSLAFGCYHPDHSDLDFIVVVRDEPSQNQKQELVAVLLRLLPEAPAKGFEMSVVLERDCRAFRYPTPFVLHFSNSHLAKCRQDLPRFCRDMNGTDPDLAAHFTVIRHTGQVLFGKEIDNVFSPVPPAAYWDSLWLDIQSAEEDVVQDPVYVLLNLCRSAAYLQDRTVLSKKQGGNWALRRLPLEWAPLIRKALSAYTTDAAYGPAGAAEKAFCRFMLGHIQTLTKERGFTWL